MGLLNALGIGDNAESDAEVKTVPPQGQKLAGKVAIVTGSDSGIGAATALLFAQEGADVAVSFHTDEAGAREVAAAIEAVGRKAYCAHLDAGNSASVKQYFAGVVDALGVPTILVNNAGAGNNGNPIAECTDQDFDSTLRVNLYGPFYFCREFISNFPKGERGSIVNVTSVHEEIPRPGAGPYCASKGGLKLLTRVLCLELAETGIRVNNLAPGMIITPMNKAAAANPLKRAAAEEHIPMRRAGQPEEMARAALFLAGPDGSYLHGSTLTADGGLEMSLGQGA